jgi:hypothetical protein
MHKFSDQTLASLREAGWDETYKYNASAYAQLYRNDGCDVPSPVLEFLRDFGGLDVSASRIHLDGVCGIKDTQHACSDLDYLSERINNQKLYYLGALYTYMELLMSENGSVYATLDHDLFWIAHTGWEALEIILTGTLSEMTKNKVNF